LTQILSVAYAGQEIQQQFVIGDTSITLVQSEMYYSGFTYLGKDGLEATISVPGLTKAMLAHYRKNHSLDDIDEVVSEIGAVVVEENKLWFGMSFYGGEGWDGMGGVGFFDPKSKKIGILRHPALLNCSVKKIQVTPLEIVALTYSQGELSKGICNGLVRINRKTLSSIIQLPKGKIQTIWNKDDELSNTGKQVAKQYETAGSDLIAHFVNWPSAAGKSLTKGSQQSFGLLGLEQFMLHQAATEYRWFDQAIKHGKVVFEQRCKLSANHTTSCEPALRNIFEQGKQCIGDKAECTMAGFIFFLWRVNDSNYKAYRCTPQAWFSISLPIDGGKVGYGDWHRKDYFSPGRKSNPTDWVKSKEEAQVPIIRSGYKASSSFQGKQFSFNVENFESTEVKCSPPYDFASGAAITSLTLHVISIEIDQEYVLTN